MVEDEEAMLAHMYSPQVPMKLNTITVATAGRTKQNHFEEQPHLAAAIHPGCLHQLRGDGIEEIFKYINAEGNMPGKIRQNQHPKRPAQLHVDHLHIERNIDRHTGTKFRVISAVIMALAPGICILERA